MTAEELLRCWFSRALLDLTIVELVEFADLLGVPVGDLITVTFDRVAS